MKNRKHILSKFIKENKIQIIAEIGVEYSRLLKYLLRNHSDLITEYWAVDPWQNNPSTPSTRKIRIEDVWTPLYLCACKLQLLFPQLHVIKLFSVDAATLFPDQYFDLVFIDADHHYEEVLSDIKAWWPKIKKGGVLSGHDYGGKKIGVKQAVNEYFGENEINLIDNIWIKKKGELNEKV